MSTTPWILIFLSYPFTLIGVKNVHSFNYVLKSNGTCLSNVHHSNPELGIEVWNSSYKKDIGGGEGRGGPNLRRIVSKFLFFIFLEFKLIHYKIDKKGNQTIPRPLLGYGTKKSWELIETGFICK